MSNFVIYRNGNYNVHLNLDDGSKFRITSGDTFIADFPESIDIKITNRCNMMCPQCHENSKIDGCHGRILEHKFIDTLKPYTELAIGGGNPLEHPDLEKFLQKCKKLKLVPSMTVHQKHFLDNIDFLKRLCEEKLLYGLGVSISYPSAELREALKEFPTAVCHVIAGITPISSLFMLSGVGLKVLILGYKKFRRGEALYEEQSEQIERTLKEYYDVLPTIVEDEWFKVVSFDNLAVEQLNVSRLMSEEHFNEFFQGEDGTHTMYIDMVDEMFAVSSTRKQRWPLLEDITEMFNVVKTGACNF